MTTYNSNCMPCMRGEFHPVHDDGTMAEEPTDVRFSQLPPEGGRVTLEEIERDAVDALEHPEENVDAFEAIEEIRAATG